VLTADLVRAKRRGDELLLVKLDAEARERAQAIAEALIEMAKEHVGHTRAEWDEATSGFDVEPRDARLKAGLAKLVEDRCAFAADETVDAVALRRDLFLHATASRRAIADARFDRDAVLDSFARDRGIARDAIERGLFADLRDAHELTGFDAIAPASLVALWERGQAQAVLLRAVRVTVDVRRTTPGATRALFHRLKFLRLLSTITRTDDGHRIVIDGPFSLFEASTKYGLELALILPMLEHCEAWSLVADVRWGKERTPLVFRIEGERTAARVKAPRLPDDVAALVAAFEALAEKKATRWRVSPAKAILDLPGVGLCVPDLVFERDGLAVHLEVMGYWSRDAVWRRVELVERGLASPLLFAVSARLRVSEEVLPEDATGALYVYKGTMSARAIAERLDALAARAPVVSS
jgi:predicted nuclease of restriction endonuclease-like RecB superfamily